MGNAQTRSGNLQKYLRFYFETILIACNKPVKKKFLVGFFGTQVNMQIVGKAEFLIENSAFGKVRPV